MAKNLNGEISTKNLATFKRWGWGYGWKILILLEFTEKSDFFEWEGGAWKKKEGVMFFRGGGWDPNVHYELEEPFYWHKYPNNDINYNWHIVSKKKKSGISNPKNSNYQIGKSLKLWSVMITIWEEWQNFDFFSIIIIHICEQKHSLQ